ncbi:restriction endonuclease subunit S, partial [Spirosoma terrae]
LLVPGEVLFNNTNSQELVGKTVYFDIDGEYFCSNHITRIKTNERLSGEFLTHLFNLYQRRKVFFKSCINWNNQSGINTDILRGIRIPLPSISVQKTIAEHIDDIRQQAQSLRQQAERDFAEAKQEIERMILG